MIDCCQGSRASWAGPRGCAAVWSGDLPLADDSLDGLITTNTVYFIEDLERAFREIARVLRSGEGDRTFHLLVASVGGSSPHP